MDFISPLISAIIIAGLAYVLREKLPWWSVPIIAFFVLVFVQFLAVLRVFSIPTSLAAKYYIELNVPISDYVLPIILVSLYFSLLFLVFTMVGVGIDRILRDKIENRFLRYVVSVYIALLLLQLWVVVFPWTVTLPYRLYWLS